MNIYSNYFPKQITLPSGFSFTLSPKQSAIVRIAAALLLALVTTRLYSLLDRWRKTVTVVDAQGGKRSCLLQEVSGKVTVIFNGLFASKATAKGYFDQGRLIKGVLSFPSGFITKEEGRFEHGRLVKGTKYFKDGRIEQGAFINELEGNGLRIHPDGRREFGYFVNGILSSPT